MRRPTIYAADRANVSPMAMISANSKPRHDREGLTPLARDQVAAFLVANGDQIRLLARKKLTKKTRSTYDSEDVLSSVFRRIDDLAANGTLRPRSDQELWGLIHTITHHAAVSRTRLMERATALSVEDGGYVRHLIDCLSYCGSDDAAMLLIHRMAACLHDSAERQLFYLRVRGANHRGAAAVLGITEVAVRRRWTVARDRLEATKDEWGRLDD
jgi:DNA-directed RNA polymerase specialized sigma24 family protein